MHVRRFYKNGSGSKNPGQLFQYLRWEKVPVAGRHLPKQMSNEELEAALKEIIAEVSAAGPQVAIKSPRK